jgi:hypothetical protein
VIEKASLYLRALADIFLLISDEKSVRVVTKAFEEAIVRMQHLGAKMHNPVDVSVLDAMRGTESFEGWTEEAYEDSFEADPELYRARGTKIEVLQDFVA